MYTNYYKKLKNKTKFTIKNFHNLKYLYIDVVNDDPTLITQLTFKNIHKVRKIIIKGNANVKFDDVGTSHLECICNTCEIDDCYIEKSTYIVSDNKCNITDSTFDGWSIVRSPVFNAICEQDKYIGFKNLEINANHGDIKDVDIHYLQRVRPLDATMNSVIKLHNNRHLYNKELYESIVNNNNIDWNWYIDCDYKSNDDELDKNFDGDMDNYFKHNMEKLNTCYIMESKIFNISYTEYISKIFDFNCCASFVHLDQHNVRSEHDLGEINFIEMHDNNTYKYEPEEVYGDTWLDIWMAVERRVSKEISQNDDNAQVDCFIDGHVTTRKDKHGNEINVYNV